jgi:hypothetical protein
MLSTFDILSGIAGTSWLHRLTEWFSAYVTSFIAAKLVRTDIGTLHRIHGWGRARSQQCIMGQALTNRIWFSETGETHDAG